MQKEKRSRKNVPEERPLRGVWKDDFENISSNTQGAPRRPDYIEERIRQDEERRRAARRRQRELRNAPPQARRRPPENISELPRWDTPQQRRTSPPTQNRAPYDRKRVKRKMAAGARRVLLAMSLVAMAVVTVVLAIFLLFKVAEIEVTGDAIEGANEAQIIEISGCKTGDNLFFLSSGSMARRIEEKLPYVRKAKIVKHFPSTVEIQLVSAQVAASVYGDGGWLYVNEDGKILEKRDTPQSGVMQIMGLSPSQTQPGKNLSVENEEVQAAYQEILSALSEVRADGTGAYSGLNLNGFTLLDMSDLSAIRMFYENRVEFQFGSAFELEYKVKAGCRFLLEMTTRETGVMDLSSAGDTKRAYFTPGELTIPVAPASGTPTDPAQADDPAPGSAPASDPASQPDSAPDTSPRDDGIPTAPYTGN